ncbi:metal-dependent hydrolase [Alteromonas halophila]|uniref:Metal-dependent hydrolase n=1 Tax=Alteromonas halophila TaxID=516698 RepID=A0A918MUU2_9ALTE|nr:metal-dependent hydrolase [Alteromonas halophila]GGW72982.1 hypothetical protein GCM10007391_00640 [Alteromonas halophila]
MDPFTHTFAGGLMASSGLKKLTPLATAAILIGVNAPDVDIVASWMGEYSSLAHRRGWTHGVLAWFILPLLLTGILMLLSRVWPRLTANGSAAFWPLFLVSLLAVLSHPFLDWLNNYGIRLLMPFDSQWFYGDSMFILDPWLWLIMGGAWFWVSSGHRWQLALWAVFWLGSSLVVTLNDVTGTPVLVLWYLGLAGIIGGRFLMSSFSPGVIARGALIMASLYIALSIFAGRIAVNEVNCYVQAQAGQQPIDIMVSPAPANPLRSTVVVVHGDHYQLGQWDWLADKPVRLDTELPLNIQSPIVQAAATAPHARQYLSWSRFPFANIAPRENGGYRVSFKDARYAHRGDTLSGPTVELDDELKVLPQSENQ